MSDAGTPRIRPGTRADIGWLNALIVGAIARRTGTRGAPRLFATLARHRRLFRAWLLFGGAMMPGGSLPRPDTELVILRVAHNCDCEYERRHHERLALAAGLEARDVERIRSGPTAPGWSARQSLLLRAADELHERRTVPDELFAELGGVLTEVELIELLMLVGHYELLAMTISSLRVQPDEIRSAPGAADALAGSRVLITGAARGIVRKVPADEDRP